VATRSDFESSATLRTYPAMWDELCADPRFQDLPYKMELLSGGQIFMTPQGLEHSRAQIRLIDLLRQHAPIGEVSIEYAIQTRDGVRVPDVVWLSPERSRTSLDPAEFSVAPELCIEVASPRTAHEELLAKAELYFQAGAKEVWICNNGEMTFLPGPSQFAPNFPTRIDLK
jgi:Uma2 family endonuclease